MTYQITVDDDKAPAFVNFLKELEFVTISEGEQAPYKEKKLLNPDEPLPYFGAFPDWDLEADNRRKNDTEKRLNGWL